MECPWNEATDKLAWETAGGGGATVEGLLIPPHRNPPEEKGEALWLSPIPCPACCPLSRRLPTLMSI